MLRRIEEQLASGHITGDLRKPSSPCATRA